jgi:AcrR family transcriptional regulator
MDGQQQHHETRARILAEAERLFRHYGYGKTTIADISHACGMSSANIYRFFPSKSALMEAICSHLIADSERRLLEIVRAPIPASERLTRFIEEMHRYTLENLLDHRKVHEMVVVALEEQWLAIRSHIERVTGMIGEIVRDGIASGEFPRQDLELTARMVHTAVVCFCHPIMVAQKLDDENRVSPQQMAAFLVRALKNG